MAQLPLHVIVFAGIPGTGKSTLADILGRTLHIPVFALDWLLGSLTPFQILNRENAAALGDALLSTLAERQLMLGQSVILDSPAAQTHIRQHWHLLADQYHARFCGIETICSDRHLHRSRVDGRTRGIAGWHELTWEHVERMRTRYESWDDDHLTLDAINPLATNLQTLFAYLQESSASTAEDINVFASKPIM
jgi:predicted kinase